MHVLVTGGAGFIGSHLAEALLNRGDSVAVLDNLSSGSVENIRRMQDHPRFSLSNEALDNAAALDRLASRADAIVHLAAAVGVHLVLERPTETIEPMSWARTRCWARPGAAVAIRSSPARARSTARARRCPFRKRTICC